MRCNNIFEEITVNLAKTVGDDIGGRWNIATLFGRLRQLSPQRVVFDWDGVNSIDEIGVKEYFDERSYVQFETSDKNLSEVIFKSILEIFGYNPIGIHMSEEEFRMKCEDWWRNR